MGRHRGGPGHDRLHATSGDHPRSTKDRLVVGRAALIGAERVE